MEMKKRKMKKRRGEDQIIMCMYVMLRILKEKKGTSDKIILGS